jgi:hypothetical protein
MIRFLKKIKIEYSQKYHNVRRLRSANTIFVKKSYDNN